MNQSLFRLFVATHKRAVVRLSIAAAAASALALSPASAALKVPDVTVHASVRVDGVPGVGGNPLGLILSALGGATGAPGTPAKNLSDALSGGQGNLLYQIACPLAQALPNVPGVNQVSAVTCALGFLNYAYKTTYVDPISNKTTVSYFRAEAGVPTPLDVNGDGNPDFLGTLTFSTGLNGLTLSISRLQTSATITPTSKVSIEAVAHDPVVADGFVGFGYDGRAAGNPASFSATLSLTSLTATSAKLGLSVSTSSAPPTLAILGELFQGNPDSPHDVQRGLISFTQVPANLTTTVSFAKTHIEAMLTSSKPAVVVPDLTLISPSEEQDVHATINQLPSSVDVAYDSANGHQTVIYTGSTEIGSLDATYHDYLGGNLTTAAAVDATGVPTGITVDLVGNTTSVTTKGGPVSLVEARYGQGTEVPALRDGTGDYAAYHKTAAATTYAARLASLQSTTVTLATDSGDLHLIGDLTLSGLLSRLDIYANDDTQNLVVTGALTGGPAHSVVTADLVSGANAFNGTATFDGNGTGISEITLDATRTKPFFSRATRLDLTVDNVPKLETFTFNSTDKTHGLTATASAPLDVTLLTSDGSDAPPSTGTGAVSGPYVDFVDQPGTFLAFVRITGVRGFAVNGDLLSDTPPTTVTKGESLLFTSFDAAQQTLTLNAAVKLGSFTGTIDKLPSHVDLTMTGGNGGDQVLTVNTQQSVDTIVLTGTSLAIPGFAGTDASVTLSNLPRSLTFTLPGTGPAVDFTASAPIGQINAVAWQKDTTIDPVTKIVDNPDAFKPPALAADSAYLCDKAGKYGVAANIVGLQALHVQLPPSNQTAPLSGSITTAGGAQNLVATVLHGSMNVTSTVYNLPGTLKFSIGAPDPTNGNQIADYSASSTITRMTLTGSGLKDVLAPLGLNATSVGLDVHGIPAHLTLTMPTAGGKLVFDPHGDHISDIIAQIYSCCGPGPLPTERQKLVFDAFDGDIGAHLSSVGEVTAQVTNPSFVVDYDLSSATPLDYYTRFADGTYMQGTVSNPQPAHVALSPNVNGAVNIDYHAAAPINSVSLESNPGGAYANITFKNIPKNLNVCLNASGGTTCEPTWIPQVPSDPSSHYIAGPICITPTLGCFFPPGWFLNPMTLGLRVDPVDNGDIPQIPVTITGIYCPSADFISCGDPTNAGFHPEIWRFDHLGFSSLVEFAADAPFKNHKWIALNTGGRSINGYISHTSAGNDKADLAVNIDPNHGQYLIANDFVFAYNYDGIATVDSIVKPCLTYIVGQTTVNIDIPLVGYTDLFSSTYLGQAQYFC